MTELLDPAVAQMETPPAVTVGPILETPPPPAPDRPGRGGLRGLSEAAGPVGLLPVVVLMLLAAAERFDAAAFGVLAPDIRSTFHLSNTQFVPLATLTGVVPLLLAVPLGNFADRTNRVWLSRVSGLVWGVTAIATGLAPALLILVFARLGGGVGQTVNQPVHSSLLSDWYPPDRLARLFTLYLAGSSGVGLLGGPLSGALGAVAGWRVAFVLLALPTFVCVALMARLHEPARGQSAGVVQDAVRISMAEGFRQIRAIRSLRRTWWAAVFFGAGAASFATLLSLYFKDVYHMGDAARGAVTIGFGVFGLVGFAVAGKLSQAQMERNRPDLLAVTNGGLVMSFGAAVLVMAVAPSEWIAILGSAAVAIGLSGFLVPYQTMVAVVAPARLRSQAYSWSLMAFTFGAIVVSVVIGGIGDAYGQRAALGVLAACVAVGGAIEISARRLVAADVRAALRQNEATHSASLLSCRGLDAGYDNVQILFGVDLEVEEGEMIALLGTNGAGKSTLLKAISGVIDATGGAIAFCGRDITHTDHIATAKLGIAQVPGGRGVFPTLTVAENLKAAGWMYRKDRAYVAQATEQVLGYFPILRSRWDTAAGSLSGGEQQMLSLAQAFIAKPKLLMIDELSLGLAPSVVERLLEIVRAIHAQGATVILVEQSVNVALQLARRAVFMEKGEVRFEGPTAELLQRPDILRSVFLQGAAAGTEVASNGSRAPSSPRRSGAAAQRRAAAARRAEVVARPVALETLGLSKSYGGVMAVYDVDLKLHEGEILGLIGPNGAGKTTIFDLITGLTPSNGGRVLLEGRDVSDRPAHIRAALGMGRSFQDARLWPALTVREALAVALERQVSVPDLLPAVFGLPQVKMSEARIARQAENLIELLGLGAFRDKFISELSTGSRRMVEIGALLAHEPRVLLLDEPSSGIAQKETEALGPLLRQVQAAMECSILIIEHDMALITSLADHIVALESGQVVTVGAPDEVLAHPQVVASYLGGTMEITGLTPPPRPSGKASAARKGNGPTGAAKAAAGAAKPAAGAAKPSTGGRRGDTNGAAGAQGRNGSSQSRVSGAQPLAGSRRPKARD